MGTWQQDARRAALANGLDPNVFVRQMGQEAHGEDLRSPAGAQGPAQFMPGTAASVGLNSTTVHQRVPAYNAAAKLMAGYVHQYGSIKNALVAYNAGPGRVGQSLPAETQNYIATILGHGGNVAASPSPSPGTTTIAAVGPSGSGQQAAPNFSDPGQSGDFTGLLGQLLGGHQQQAPQSQAVAPPQFSAMAPMPKGFMAATPDAQAGPAQGQGVSGALSLIGGLRGTDPASAAQSAAAPADAPQGPVAVTVANQRAAGKTAGGVISANARPGDPVVSSKQSVGGEHETAGLAGYPAHDFFAPAGSHAVAPVSGTVIRLSGHDPADGPTQGPHGPLGWSVYIKGSDGRTYFLTHMGSRNVQPGQKIVQGQVIGTVANYDKYGTPSHIHMGVSG